MVSILEIRMLPESSETSLIALAPFMNLITFAERRQSARASSPGGEQWPHLNLVFVTSHYSHAATGNPFTKWERKYLLFFYIYIYISIICVYAFGTMRIPVAE